MYFETSNEYGLVSIVNNAVSTLADYSNLKSAMSTVSPTGVNSASYSPTNTVASCPAIGTAWAAKASPLPPSPNRSVHPLPSVAYKQLTRDIGNSASACSTL